MTMPIAIQHTLAVMALTTARACLDVFTVAVEESELAAVVKIINERIAECSTSTKRRKLSAGAKRDLDYKFGLLGPFFTTNQAEDEARFEAWAANAWVALTMLEDCKNTCNAFCATEEWRDLTAKFTQLADALVELAPGADEVGTDIYMKVV